MMYRAIIAVGCCLAALAAATIQPSNPQVQTAQFTGTTTFLVADPANYKQPIQLTPTSSPTGVLPLDPSPLLSGQSAAWWLPTNSELTPSGQLPAAIASGTQTVTITGTEFPLGASTVAFLSYRGGSCTEGPDPLFQQAIATVNGIGTTVTFTLPTSSTPGSGGCSCPGNAYCTSGAVPARCWNDYSLELETLFDQTDDIPAGRVSGLGRKICLQFTIPVPGVLPAVTNTFNKWTGFNVKVAWNCDVPTGVASQQCNLYNQPATIPTGRAELASLSLLEQMTTYGVVRTTCCKSSIGLGIGVCVNPNVHTCCGGQPFSPANEKCCNQSTQVVVTNSVACPCRSNGQTATGIGGVNTDCPVTAPTCCLPTKYPDLFTPAVAPSTPVNLPLNVWGGCYNVNNTAIQCCNTGDLFDPGSQQCCSINGLQSLNDLCPCTTTADCAGGVAGQTTQTQCCRALAPDVPPPFEHERCSAYANYYQNPLLAVPGSWGTGNLDLQRCFGQCIDTRYQICCLGTPCLRWYEKCCNTTCCNRYSASCDEGRRPGARGSQFNTNDFRVTFYTCTSIEILTVLKSGMIFIIPLILLIATLAGLGIVLVFANKASNRSYSFLETTMIALSVLSIFASIPLYFSPLFKYGIFIVLTSLVSILSAAARIRALNIIALVAQFVILMYIFDPIHGNRYLTFTSYPHITGRNAGIPDTNTKGILHTTTYMFDIEHGTRWCTDFYDYFRLDPILQDTDRFDNPYINTFGYCKRGWVAFLLYFEGLLILFFLLLFVVTLLALVLRFRKIIESAAVELEVQKYGIGY